MPQSPFKAVFKNKTNNIRQYSLEKYILVILFHKLLWLHLNYLYLLFTLQSTCFDNLCCPLVMIFKPTGKSKNLQMSLKKYYYKIIYNFKAESFRQ